MNNNKLVIVPAAGFGRRVGSPTAKEMMIRPKEDPFFGEPLIFMPLELAKKSQAKIHIVTRSSKSDLLEYLENLKKNDHYFNNNLSIQIVEITKEWPDSILKSQPYWLENNLILLPDTTFAPLHAFSNAFSALDKSSDLVFATIEKSDYQSWGVVDFEMGQHCEKPKKWTATTRAWGFIGFKKAHGLALLESLLMSTFDSQWRDIGSLCSTVTPTNEKKICEIKLEQFVDLTRPQ